MAQHGADPRHPVRPRRPGPPHRRGRRFSDFPRGRPTGATGRRPWPRLGPVGKLEAFERLRGRLAASAGPGWRWPRNAGLSPPPFSHARTRSGTDGDQVFLRPPERSDYEEWASLRAASRDFLSPCGADLAARRLEPSHVSARGSPASARIGAPTRVIISSFSATTRRWQAGSACRAHAPRHRQDSEPRLLDRRHVSPGSA